MTFLMPDGKVVADQAQDIRAVLNRYRFYVATEDQLQVAIANAFDERGIAYEREVRLNERDRIDFMVGFVGVEVKVAGSWRTVRRQLTRYAESERIGALLLVTTRTMHVNVPRDIEGTPVYVHILLGAAL